MMGCILVPLDGSVLAEKALVTIGGKMKAQEKEEKKDNYIYRERKSGAFFRQVRLPVAVDGTNVEAYLVDGGLKRDLTKTTESTTTWILVKNSHLLHLPISGVRNWTLPITHPICG